MNRKVLEDLLTYAISTGGKLSCHYKEMIEY